MLNYISLKDYFGGEATGFTPWLQNHSQIIKDILKNENITLYKREMKVDSYYLDLLYRDGNELFVVENQYGESDHDHLGKCIVYSSLVNAKKTIWIAEEFSNEYDKIFQSLNIDLILCSVTLEIIDIDTVMLKFYISSKDGIRQQIYKLNKDKEIVHTISC